MSRPAARKAAPKGEYIETVRQQPLSINKHQRKTHHAHPHPVPLSFFQKNDHLPFPPLTPPQDSGNKVSRRSAITGTANITLGGRTVIMADVQLRGDLHPTRSAPSSSGKDVTPTSISIGRCTVISQGSVIKPPSRISRGQVHYYPMKIGDNVFVGMFVFDFLFFLFLFSLM
jgi:hypothetical protein